MAGPFEAAGVKIEAQIAAAIDAFAEIIMAESLEQCPIETGTLRRSARVASTTPVAAPKGGFMIRNAKGQFAGKANFGGNEITTILGYGFGSEINPKTRKPASEYAVPVHEIIEAYHEPPTKAKFLEDPVYEHAAMMEPFLAGAMRDIGIERVLATIEGTSELAAEGAGMPAADLDAGDHPLGTPHE